MRNRGLTIIEVLVAAVVMSLAIGGMYSLVFFGGRTTNTSMVHADCALRERIVLSRLTSEMTHCKRILYPLEGGYSDYLLFESQAGLHHILRLTPGRRHLILSVIERKDNYVVADTENTPLVFSRLVFHRTGDGVDMSLSFRNGEKEDFRLFSHAFTGLGVEPDGLR